MSSLQELAKQKDQMGTVVSLTSVFESLASMRIAQVKDQVLQAQDFFNELWHIYSQLRVDSLFRFGRTDAEVSEKELFIAITAEGGFSGDIDQRLISWMLTHYDPQKHDIIIVGHHGALQLAQAGVSYIKYFKLPQKDQNLNVEPLVREIRQYKSTTVYYQTYVSLMVQDIKRLELSKAVEDQGRSIKNAEDIISEQNYIFEPSTFDVIAHLERSMLQITLSQTLLESKLAQYASRFRAMSGARERATEDFNDLRLGYNRTKRAVADERLKEIINGYRKASRV